MRQLSNSCKSIFNLCLGRREPFSLVHFITNRCNARCGHCFIDFESCSDSGNELTIGEIDKLTKSMGSNLYNVNLTGGEPFIRDDIFEIVELYVRNTPVKSIVITTNGWFVDAIGSFVRRYSELDTSCRVKISISIDNFEPQHDIQRKVAGLYARAVESYRLLDACKDQRISAGIALTVTPSNERNVLDVFRHLQNIGVKEVFPILLREEGVLKNISGKSELLQAYNDLVLLTEKTAINSSSFADMLVDALQRGKNRIVHRLLCDTYCSPRFVAPCTAGSLFGVIHADGNVSPCEVLGSSFGLGNLRDHGMNFLAIWGSLPAKTCRQRILDGKCHCTFECAWTVNVISNPVFWPRLACYTLWELLWNRTA